MYSRLIPRRSRGLALLVVAVVAALVAGAAHAGTGYLVDTDSVSTIGSGTSFEFRKGEVDWYWGSGEISAHLGGEIKIDEANGSCARMRLEYFNDSVEIGTPTYGGTVCAPDSDSHYYTVDLNSWGSPDIDLIKVSLEKETASTGWSTVGQSAYVKPDIPNDKVYDDADGLDFGGDTWGIGAPIGDATLYWNQGEGMNLTPHLQGTLWLNNVAGACARVDMRSYNYGGQLLHEEASGRVCPSDNGFYDATIDIGGKWTSDQISAVTVHMQTQRPDGSWQDGTDDNWSGYDYPDDFTGPCSLCSIDL
jgi:hypothetical protein